MYAILICSCTSQISKLCNIFKDFISYLYAVILCHRPCSNWDMNLHLVLSAITYKPTSSVVTNKAFTFSLLLFTLQKHCKYHNTEGLLIHKFAKTQYVRTGKLQHTLQLTFQSIIYEEWFNDTAGFALWCFQGLTHHTDNTLSIHCPVCKKRHTQSYTKYKQWPRKHATNADDTNYWNQKRNYQTAGYTLLDDKQVEDVPSSRSIRILS
jgi:hypothetical protein